METTGSAFLLQETAPKRLVGSIVSRLDSNGLGWVHLVFFPEADVLWIAETEEGLNGQMSRQIAMSLISSVEVSLAQIDALRVGGASASLEARARTLPHIDVVVTSATVSASCSCTEQFVVIRSQDEQREVQMDEFFSRQLLKAMVGALGAFAARGHAQ